MYYYKIVNDEILISLDQLDGYTEISEEDLKILIRKDKQIKQLKAQLLATDYKAIKYAEGYYTNEEYAPIKAEREAIREQIRSLEA